MNYERVAVGAFRSLLTFPGIDPTGATDCATGLQAAVNALGSTGQGLWVPAGTYLVNSVINIPSNITIQGQKGASTIQGNLGIKGSPGNAVFLATSTPSAFSTTLSANSVNGSPIVHMNAAPIAGQIVGLQSVAAVLREARYTVLSVSGAGPYTVTLDRPVLKSFLVNDNVLGYSTVPVNIYILGLNIAGIADRMLEFNLASRCQVEDCFFSPTAACDIVASFDIGGLENAFRRCFVDGAGVAGIAAGLALETNESSIVVDCEVRHLPGGGEYGVAMYDCDDCGVLSSEVSQASNGVGVVADGDNVGCQYCYVQDTLVVDCGTYGIINSNGSTYTRIVNCTAINCATNGIYDFGGGGGVIDSCTVKLSGNAGIITNISGGVGTQITDCYVETSTTFDLELATPADISGLRCHSTAAAAGSVYIAGTGEYRIRGFECDFASGNGIRIGAGAVCRVSQAKIVADSNTLTCIANGGILHIQDATLSGGSVGIATAAASTSRIGSGVDLQGNTTPMTVTGYANRKQTVTANGTTGVAVAWPDIKSTDVVQFTMQTPSGAFGDPKYTITPGTGFTFASTAATDLGTYEYFIP